MGYPDEGFYEGGDDFGDEGEGEGWSDEAPVVAREQAPQRRGRPGEGPYGILGRVRDE